MSEGRAQPKVSVVIPVYNMGTYLAQALDSVLAQAFADWDAWVVDDGSKDNSPEIARKYAAKHPDRIHYSAHEGHQNRGVSASRNLAVSQSHGKLLAFLDADDLWTADKLKEQVKVFEAHPEVGLVYSSAIPIRADGTLWSATQDGESPVKIVFDKDGQARVGYGTPNKPVALFEELVRHCCLINSSVMVRRAILDKAGRFDEAMRYGEDWLLYTCVAYHAPAYFIDEPMVRYRIHSSHFSAGILGNELAYLEGAATFLQKLPDRLDFQDANLTKLLGVSRLALYGRALTRAEEAWHRGRFKEALTFAKFAWSTCPGLFFSRRTGRFLRTVLMGASASKTA